MWCRTDDGPAQLEILRLAQENEKLRDLLARLTKTTRIAIEEAEYCLTETDYDESMRLGESFADLNVVLLPEAMRVLAETEP